MQNLQLISQQFCFGGWQRKYSHQAQSTQCTMQFSVYLPPAYHTTKALPVVLWLSGLTCNDDNFSQKAGAQRVAAELGLALVIPDTSPRGENVADDDSYDLGQGAGFYLNATQAPWAQHYQMYNYITTELPTLVCDALGLSQKWSITGHSMGGHGALVIGLRNPQQFAAISAFAPIVNPCTIPWGQKAFTAYLGEDATLWEDYDACKLLEAKGCPLPLRIDQGLADNFLDEQQLTRPFEKACQSKGVTADIRYHENYDHSYFFIASFMEAHLRFHAKALEVG